MPDTTASWKTRTYKKPPVHILTSPVADVLRALPLTTVTQAQLRREETMLHRGHIIATFGAWLRDNPKTVDLKGLMSEGPPCSVWLHWSFAEGEGDLHRYSVYFPVTDLYTTGKPTARLWIKAPTATYGDDTEKTKEGWSPLTTFSLANYQVGDELGRAIIEFLDAGEMDTIYRWIEGGG